VNGHGALSVDHEIENLRIMGATVASASIRLTIPPARIRDVQKLLQLEAHGFIPKGQVHFDPDDQAFVLELDGEAVSHVLDLLMIATDDRESETWQERQSRELAQLRLSLDAESFDTSFVFPE
jgi:hypothetical protein